MEENKEIIKQEYEEIIDNVLKETIDDPKFRKIFRKAITVNVTKH